MKFPVKPNFMTNISFICVSNGFVIGVIEQYFDFKDASLSKIGQYSIELILHVPCGLLFQIDYDLHSCFVHSETNMYHINVDRHDHNVHMLPTELTFYRCIIQKNAHVISCNYQNIQNYAHAAYCNIVSC